jgi:hypothetical protein
METPNKSTNKNLPTPLNSLDPSDFDSTPVSKRMSKPRTVKPSRAAGHLKKMASGLASLYDEIDQGILESPIYVHGSLEVMPPNIVIDLTTPEVASNRLSGVSAPMDRTIATVNIEDGIEVDKAVSKSATVKIEKVRSEWVRTSKFFIEQNAEWQENVSGLLAFKSHHADNCTGTARFAHPIPPSNSARLVPKFLRSLRIHISQSNRL